MSNIVLDIDGVLCDFVGGFARTFGSTPSGAEWTIPPEAWHTLKSTKDWWADLAPLPGARLLARMGPLPQHFYLLTSRCDYTWRQTMMWLEANEITIPPERVLFAPRSEKPRVLAELAPVAFLDDSVYNVGLSGKVPDVDAYLMLQPYNREAVAYFNDLQTVESVREFLWRSGAVR